MPLCYMWPLSGNSHITARHSTQPRQAAAMEFLSPCLAKGRWLLVILLTLYSSMAIFGQCFTNFLLCAAWLDKLNFSSYSIAHRVMSLFNFAASQFIFIASWIMYLLCGANADSLYSFQAGSRGHRKLNPEISHWAGCAVWKITKLCKSWWARYQIHAYLSILLVILL